MISFTVYGVPAPAGSKRHVGGGRIVDASKRSAPWKQEVAAAAAIAVGGEPGVIRPGLLLFGPLSVSMTFYLPRPKGHYSNGQRSRAPQESFPLLPSAPAFPTTRPDVLKLARAVEDACTGIIWRDDAQIVYESLAKLYGEPARVEVNVTQQTSGPPQVSAAHSTEGSTP